MLKSLIMLFSGAIVGIILVISCSDDAPGKVDAADPVCDCPPAEPPLTGRFYYVDDTGAIAPNAQTARGAACRVGDQLIGGSCVTPTGTLNDIQLEQSGASQLPSNPAWTCVFRNNTAIPVDVKTTAICLDVTP